MKDEDIRARLQADFDRDGTPWVDEVKVGDRRADMVAIVRGVLTSIEIKSDKDTLKRLEEQFRLFDRCFRQVLVVTEPRHVEGVKTVVGPHCGIWVCEEVDGGFYLRTRSRAFGTRTPRPRQRPHPARIAHLLRKAELKAVLRLPEDAPLTRGELSARAGRELAIEDLERAVLEMLRVRKIEAGKPHLASGGA